MSSNEEYLDNLLKSLTDESPNLVIDEEQPEMTSDENVLEQVETISEEDIDLAEFFSKEELADSFIEESSLEKEENNTESVMDLLDTMSDDDDLAEISELLKKNDSNELVNDDMMDIFNNNGEESFDDEMDEISQIEMPEELQDIDIFAELEALNEEQSNGEESSENDIDFILNSQNEDMPSETRKEKRKREKAEKKERKQALQAEKTSENTEGSKDIEIKEKKKNSFFTKLMALLFEADEEEEFDMLAEGTVPSDENIAILQEVDQEKGKKKKEKKAKKGKKGAEETKENGEESETEEKPKKEKKPKKPKKEKKQAPQEEEKGKKISTKKMIQVFIVCFSFMAFLILAIQFIPSILDSMQGRNAYHQKDYVEAYQMFYGKKLNESDEILFHRAETILKLDRKYQSYLNYQKMEKPLEALDALMQGIAQYPVLLMDAEEYAVTDEVNKIYADIVSALEEFGISEDMAKEINAYEDDYTYTKRLEAIVYGTEFVDPNAVETVETIETEVIPDMLPEETVYTDNESTMQDLLEEEMTLPPTENSEIEIIDAEINIEE